MNPKISYNLRYYVWAFKSEGRLRFCRKIKDIYRFLELATVKTTEDFDFYAYKVHLSIFLYMWARKYSIQSMSVRSYSYMDIKLLHIYIRGVFFTNNAELRILRKILMMNCLKNFYILIKQFAIVYPFIHILLLKQHLRIFPLKIIAMLL